MARRRRPLSPAQALALSICGLIGAGTVLLALPISWGERPIPLLDAFFTSTSAVCVTGLTVVDTPAALSLTGRIVLGLLIQAGGLGYMVITTVVTAALGRRLTLQERLSLQEALNVGSREGLVRFAWTVFRVTLVFELSGALVLAAWWAPSMGLPEAVGMGLFHAVSAFNNAGFALYSDNLVRFRGDVVVNLVVSTLVVAGGLGFVVIREVSAWRPGRRLTLHARLVLGWTAGLVVVGAAVIFALEHGNPRTLGPLGVSEALLASYFQSITTRTAGFNTIDISATHEITLFLMMALMFIGASPGGTGGGVKTTTFGVTVTALWATVRGAEDAVVFRRRVPPAVVARAFFICLIAFLAVNVTAALVLLVEHRPLVPVLFETTSAFGTVGLSMGAAGTPLSLSGQFDVGGKLLIIGMMFMGRVGPLTLALALAHAPARPRVRYPEGKVLIG